MLKSDEEIREKYTVQVDNKFAGLDQLTTIEEKWQMMKDSISKAAKEHIPTTGKKEHKRWMNKKILDLMEDRRKAKVDEKKYKELDKLVKKKCTKAKEEWINMQCIEIEMNADFDSNRLHEKIRDVTGKKTSTTPGCIKAKDGEIIIEKEDSLNRWSKTY